MVPSPLPPRILFLGHGAERTGPPIHLAHLLRWLQERGGVSCEVIVARRGPLVDDYRRSGATVTVAARGREPLEPVAAALRRAGSPGAARAIPAAWMRARLARTPRPDLVYVNTVATPTLALLDAVPHRDAPLLVHVHELGIGLSAVPEAHLADLLARADALVAASHAVADHLVDHHRVDRAAIQVAHELVDVAAAQRAALDRTTARRRMGLSDAAIVVGSVGLPDWRKAPEHLLHAIWRLRRDRPDLDLRVVWIGGSATSPDGHRLEDEARRLGLEDRLLHLDHVPTPTALLPGLDMFALPSREDAYPLAALEAAAAQLPLVAFASGGIAELVDHEVGRMVAYPDVSALAAAIEELADDPELRARLGAAAALRVGRRHDVGVGAPRIWAAAEAAMDVRP